MFFEADDGAGVGIDEEFRFTARAFDFDEVVRHANSMILPRNIGRYSQRAGPKLSRRTVIYSHPVEFTNL